MDKKYIKYSLEDFTQDLNFINWVKKGINQKEWENFVLENPNISKDIYTAKKIVSTLRYNTNDLQEDDVYEIYKNIEIFHTLHHRSKRTIRFRKIMQYAALFVLVLSIGAAIPFIYFSQSSDRFTEIPVSSSGLNEAKLILSGGEEILLKEKQADLQFNAAGNQIKIDHDSIINYNRKTDPNAMAQVVIPYGKRSSILLSDGTKIWLNAGSKLIFPQKFSGKNRKVFLKGEAYFDVFKNKDIPFIVSTEKMNVTVHGTEFNMRDYDSDDELEVVLVEGAVSLKENGVMNLLGKEIKLSPNQKAVYSKADNKTRIESNIDVAYYISWKEGLLEFNRESILNVFKRLSRFYNVRFVTESSVELNGKISGKLDLKESLEDVMKVVSDAAPITFRIDQDKVFVNSKIRYMPMR
ncbi:MAG: FecR family protein [Peptostreptococcaceae bacterium]|nr:FecR family protein [Peptostreptococcaceae bacterium]